MRHISDIIGSGKGNSNGMVYLGMKGVLLNDSSVDLARLYTLMSRLVLCL